MIYGTGYSSREYKYSENSPPLLELLGYVKQI